MNIFKKMAVFKLCIALILPSTVWAQAQPSNVNRAVSGTVQNVMTSRGFASNDPRFGNTVARVSQGLAVVAGGASAVVAGTVTAPAWVSVLLVVGVSAVVTYAVNLGLNALTNWLFRPDGKIDQSGVPIPNSSYAALVVGQPAWQSNRWINTSGLITTVVTWGGDGNALVRESYASFRAAYGLAPMEASCTTLNGGNRIACGSVAADRFPSYAGTPCPAGTFWVAGTCSVYGFAEVGGVPSVTGQTLQAAITNLPGSDLNKPLNPVIIAAIADLAWKNAASQPGYDGLPYQMSQPITAAQVQPWLDQNPSYVPTVGDFVAPNPITQSQPTPWAMPQNPNTPVVTLATTPNQNTVNPSTQPLSNLGADPGIGAPSLEATPTAQAILQPILTLMPDLKNYSPSMSSGTCPRPTLNLLGQTHTLESHCAILDNNKAALHAAMVLAFAMAALFIVLSA